MQALRHRVRQLQVPKLCTAATCVASSAMGSSQSASPSDCHLVAAINSFGSELFDRLRAEVRPPRCLLAAAKRAIRVDQRISPTAQGEPDTDVFLSPYGIARALGMLLNGAEPGGSSEQELRALAFGGMAASLAALNASLQQLSAALSVEPSDDLAVADANSAWVAPRYALQQRYAAALRAAFGAEAAPLTGAAAINDWVSAATRGKISSIVDDAGVSQVRSIW